MPMAEKVEALKEFHRPSSAKDLKRFLGLAGYYRAMVKEIAAPLYRLLEKSAKFGWDGLHEKLALVV
jgi:hypothetical protein